MSHDSAIQRRDFLAGAGASVAVCASGVAVSAAAAPARAAARELPSDVAQLTADHFDALVGQTFHVHGSPYLDQQQHATLVLKEVVRQGHPSDKERPAQVRREGFSLYFAAPHNEQLSDGTHSVTIAGTARCDLFLHGTRDAKQPQLRHYEAVFN